MIFHQFKGKRKLDEIMEIAEDPPECSTDVATVSQQDTSPTDLEMKLLFEKSSGPENGTMIACDNSDCKIEGSTRNVLN